MASDHYKDKQYSPHKLDQTIGSEHDGDGEGVHFSLAGKEPRSSDRMAIIEDAYVPRYKEYR